MASFLRIFSALGIQGGVCGSRHEHLHPLYTRSSMGIEGFSTSDDEEEEYELAELAVAPEKISTFSY